MMIGAVKIRPLQGYMMRNHWFKLWVATIILIAVVGSYFIFKELDRLQYYTICPIATQGAK